MWLDKGAFLGCFLGTSGLIWGEEGTGYDLLQNAFGGTPEFTHPRAFQAAPF